MCNKLVYYTYMLIYITSCNCYECDKCYTHIRGTVHVCVCVSNMDGEKKQCFDFCGWESSARREGKMIRKIIIFFLSSSSSIALAFVMQMYFVCEYLSNG